MKCEVKATNGTMGHFFRKHMPKKGLQCRDNMVYRTRPWYVPRSAWSNNWENKVVTSSPQSSRGQRGLVVSIYDSAHVTWVKRAIEDYIATFPENREKDGEIRIVIYCEKTDADTFDCKIDCEEAHE